VTRFSAAVERDLEQEHRALMSTNTFGGTAVSYQGIGKFGLPRGAESDRECGRPHHEETSCGLFEPGSCWLG
jgi:hypothetical protein